MKKLFLLFIVFPLLGSNLSFGQIDLLYLKDQTPEYKELIQFYKELDQKYASAKLLSYPESDAGLPLQLFLIDKKQEFAPNPKRATILIMNGIHAGESCGVSASMNLAMELLENDDLAENCIIGIIPFYNIGGALNRNSTTRANQNGPKEYGFRGNAKNLDLNRDFIKNDSKNAAAFARLFHEWKPQIFIDTHTSNGADYQYPFTLISTQKDKLSPVLQPFLVDILEPYLYSGMEKKGFIMTPYVNLIKKTPDDGIAGFLDLPRYSTGYTALFNTIGFTTEAHMFKPFPVRVEATKAFLELIVSFTNERADEIVRNKRMADRMMINTINYDLNWVLNDSIFHMIEFKGYKADYKMSEISGKPRLYYDRNQAYTDSIKYFDTYKTTLKVKRPKYYIVPQAFEEVVERLKLNKVSMQRLAKDSTMIVKVYYIDAYESSTEPYEGHYIHSKVKLRILNDTLNFRAGDLLIPMGQVSDNYIISVLDPRGPDSFFAWNFFDSFLQQKEWFSPYVFEDEAAQILASDPKLKAEFNKKKASDKSFREDPEAQLYYIYKRSSHHEKEHMRYPIFRLD